MDKYLKMADVFDLPIHGSSAEFFPLCLSKSAALIAAHAINSHDELVAEVERLRGENEMLMKCRMAAREFFNCTVASGGSVKVSSASKAALDEADKASDWLEIELKATADLVKK